jgi:hypothetical protein
MKVQNLKAKSIIKIGRNGRKVETVSGKTNLMKILLQFYALFYIPPSLR